ncbi:dihydrofolate reductase family protein [Desertihabitans aurantiacus]|uniref:dihydrofolate reductase family protein n=1 Tax=Desertihabitans aurantiacus TaxID=2282477 RepID=UPI000DF7F7ED|nr:dihydrofolate reductase family protein [Desertihabitans aurantiacus]
MADVAAGGAAGGGKVVVNRSVSVDGFIAGPDDDMGWALRYMRENRFPEVMAETGAMLVGRRTHDVSRRMAVEDTEYDGGPVFVLTHHPPADDQGVTFLSCDLPEAIAAARAAADGKDVEILGADLATQCLQRGLVDEVLVYVIPVILGDGVRFSAPGLSPVELEPYENRQSGPVTMLRFRVLKQHGTADATPTP